MSEFLKAIPAAAQSPYALVAYAVAAMLMAYGGFRLYQLQAVLKAIKGAQKTGGSTLQEIIEIATNTKLPAKISGEQWLRNNRQQGVLLIIIALIIAITVVSTIALVTTRQSPKGLSEEDVRQMRAYLERLAISGETNPEKLRQIFSLGYVLFGADHEMIYLPKIEEVSAYHHDFDLKNIKLYAFTPTHITVTVPSEGKVLPNGGMAMAIPRANGLLQIAFSNPPNVELRAKMIKDYGTAVIAAIGFAEKGGPVPQWEKENWEPWWLDKKFGPTQTMIMPKFSAQSNETLHSSPKQ